MAPDQIKRCTRCILPSLLTSVTFDAEGVCNHCRDYEKSFGEWDLIKDRREKEFVMLLEKARSLNRPYDCLVPLSGGKDSTYALYLCARVYKMKTLAVTFDNGYLSQPARNNIANALRSCDADHIFYSINGGNSSEIFREFTVKTGDFCNACMRGINYSIELASRQFRTPLIIKGSGRRVQYISQIKEVTSLNTASYCANVVKGTHTGIRYRHLYENKTKLEFQKIVGGILDVAGVSRSKIMRFMPQHIGIYDYVYKTYPEIIDLIKKEMRWDDHAGPAEHLDCELHDIPFYKDSIKIPGITGKTFYRSGLIRQSLLTREEALDQEENDLSNSSEPPVLHQFLETSKISLGDYVRYVKRSDSSKYEPKLQKLTREFYHRFRKY